MLWWKKPWSLSFGVFVPGETGEQKVSGIVGGWTGVEAGVADVDDDCWGFLMDAGIQLRGSSLVGVVGSISGLTLKSSQM